MIKKLYQHKSKKTKKNYKKICIKIKLYQIIRSLKIGANTSPKPNALLQNMNLNIFTEVLKINRILCRCQFSFHTEKQKRASVNIHRMLIYKKECNRRFLRVDSR
jgi:hypothetical protein